MNDRLIDQSKAVVWQMVDKIRMVRAEQPEEAKKRETGLFLHALSLSLAPFRLHIRAEPTI
jgi:hypothetical protein